MPLLQQHGSGDATFKSLFGKEGVDERDAQHQKRRPEDELRVLLGDPLVDDPLDQAGDGEVHEDEE